MDIQSALLALEKTERNLAAINHAGGILHYDGVTAAPRNSAKGRADTFAWLAEQEFIQLTDSQVEESLGSLAENLNELSDNDSIRVRLLKEEYDKIAAVPMEEYVSYNVLVNESEDVWRKSKENNDFATFGPYVDRIVAIKKRFAEYYNDKADPYDVWLNEFERGSSSEIFDNYFTAIKPKLIDLIKEISGRPFPDISFLKNDFPIYLQRKLSKDLIDFLKIDTSRCAIGETEHPFTNGFNYYDCRITTHYYSDNILSSIYSVIHEGGHALYEMNMDESFYGTILTKASMGIHESQSRFYENIIGRSRSFTGYILPTLRKYFPCFEQVDDDMLYRAINLARPSLIRIEADELTYSMHIIIRYEIEKLLFSGEITQKELPGLWNRLYKEYLGVDVVNDAVGVLQDTHWGSGLFGYFPSYSIGSAYSAQMLYHMQKNLNVEKLISEGDTGPILEWFKTGIYKYGATKTPAELIEISCGESFNPKYYTDYLDSKFRDLYNI